MKIRILLPLAILLCAPAALVADQQADSLYKQSQATNDQQAAVELLCKAAELDQATYGKKCNDAKQYLDSRLQKFDGLFVSGKTKFDAKQWSDIVKQLDQVLTDMEKLVETADDQKLAAIAPTVAKIATHNAYHDGQIIYVRKLQGSWNPDKGVK